MSELESGREQSEARGPGESALSRLTLVPDILSRLATIVDRRAFLGGAAGTLAAAISAGCTPPERQQKSPRESLGTPHEIINRIQGIQFPPDTVLESFEGKSPFVLVLIAAEPLDDQVGSIVDLLRANKAAGAFMLEHFLVDGIDKQSELPTIALGLPRTPEGQYLRRLFASISKASQPVFGIENQVLRGVSEIAQRVEGFASQVVRDPNVLLRLKASFPLEMSRADFAAVVLPSGIRAQGLIDNMLDEVIGSDPIFTTRERFQQLGRDARRAYEKYWIAQRQGSFAITLNDAGHVTGAGALVVPLPHTHFAVGATPVHGIPVEPLQDIARREGISYVLIKPPQVVKNP
jgi:hypothetical protein